MTVARARGAIVVGVEGHVIDVEADVGGGLPGMTIVGLPDTAVAEARDRARAAVVNSGLSWPERKVTVGLSPASLPKRGSALDLSVAVAVLTATGAIPAAAVEDLVLVGELGLDGRVRPVRGVVGMALGARAQGIGRIVVPVDNAPEAALVGDIDVIAVRSLAHLRAVLLGHDRAADWPRTSPDSRGLAQPDLADVRGQHRAREALAVAAAGGHHLALLGPPGVGKTVMAERLPGLLPDLDDRAALEVTSIRSAAGRSCSDLVRRPPYEAPHHSASSTSIIGGGSGAVPRPGLVTMAHRGVLFLDEAPEFDRSVLESLRQPLESGVVAVARAGFAVTLPARFQLVLAANPCPCGRGGSECSCTSTVRRRYAARLSGPLLDRIDLRVVMHAPSAHDLGDRFPAEPSAVVATRVAEARGRARARLAGHAWSCNADIPGAVLRRTWPPSERGRALLERALADGRISLRGADRILRCAWTVADLFGRERPGAEEVGHAMALRGIDSGWSE